MVEARTVLRDCLPVKSASAPAAGHVRHPASLRGFSSKPHLGLAARFEAAFARARSAADEARTILRDCLPVRSVAGDATPRGHSLSIPSRPRLGDRLGAAVAGARKAAEDARALLLDCMPVRRAADPAECFTYHLSTPVRLGLIDHFGAVVARARSAAESARAILLDCMPVRSAPSPASSHPRSLSVPSSLGLSELFGAGIARARLAADETRSILRDFLPVKTATGLAVGPMRPLAPAHHRSLAAWFPYSAEECAVLALVFLPFLLVASAIVITVSVRRVPYQDIVAVRQEPLALPQSAARDVTVGPVGAGAVLRSEPPLVEMPDVPAGNIGEVRTSGVAQSPVMHAPPQIAMLEAPNAAPQIARLSEERGICIKTAAISGVPATASLVPPPAEFGLKLAEAARAQVGGFVIYNDKYRSISYPMGDVPPLFGVCTDVVVRAYRALGLDLQELVHEAKSGSGDKNIDHRRTEVLRRFFKARGESLPITTFAEDYLPGDIVTYYRPQNRRNRSHIAIVSATVAPSGRPMIIHNRGWGPQIEDALFVDQITGHYRYSGPSPKPDVEKASADEATRIPGATGASGSSSAVMPIAFTPRNRAVAAP